MFASIGYDPLWFYYVACSATSALIGRFASIDRNPSYFVLSWCGFLATYGVILLVKILDKWYKTVITIDYLLPELIMIPLSIVYFTTVTLVFALRC